MITICVAGGAVERIVVVGASPFGLKVRAARLLVRDQVVTLHGDGLAPLAGRVSWTSGPDARIAFAEPLDGELFRAWFDMLA